MRRTPVVKALALTVGLFGVGVTPAVAESVVPELPAPEGTTAFTDDPAILNPHPQSIDSWSRLPDPHAIAVHFTSGVPECSGVHAEVRETADTVSVHLQSGTPPGSEGRMCVMLAVPATLFLPVDAPVGHRAVISG